MDIRLILCGSYAQNTYLITRQDNPFALLIDAGDDLPAIEKAILESGKKLGAILLTHGHFDHSLAAAPLSQKYGCPIYIHEGDRDYLKDRRLSCYISAYCRLPFDPVQAQQPFSAAKEGTPLSVCGFDFTVYHTPGHTPGSVCYRPQGENFMFTGDTLFAQGYGRMDLPGGDSHQMIGSLKRLFALPRDLSIHPGHGDSGTIGQAGDALW